MWTDCRFGWERAACPPGVASTGQMGKEIMVGGGGFSLCLLQAEGRGGRCGLHLSTPLAGCTLMYLYMCVHINAYRNWRLTQQLHIYLRDPLNYSPVGCYFSRLVDIFKVSNFLFSWAGNEWTREACWKLSNKTSKPQTCGSWQFAPWRPFLTSRL